MFVAVVDADGFSAAAARLGVTKSAVSRRLAELEDRLGTRLLNRTTRRLSLTEAGAAFHGRAVRILADLDEAERSAADSNEAARGLLRVAAPMSFGMRHVGPAVADFLVDHPEVEIDLDLNDRYVDLVDEGFDVAVRIGRLRDSSLIARKLAEARRVVCASPAYLARHGRPGRPEHLREHRGLAYANISAADYWQFLAPSGDKLTVRVPSRLRANNGDVLLDACEAGLGVLILPSFFVAGAIEAGRLEPLFSDGVVPGVGIYAVYPHARHLSPKVRLFVDFLARRFGPVPPWERGLAHRSAAA